MARGRGKKALYEVISNGVRKTSPAGGNVDPAVAGAGPLTGRPRTLQFYSGRVEISAPYQIAAAALLFLVLLMLLAFRLGQACGKAVPEPPETIGSHGDGPAVLPPIDRGAKNAVPAARTGWKQEEYVISFID